jgi:single-stranded DNA-specific DHH superfamily exonuclease
MWLCSPLIPAITQNWDCSACAAIRGQPERPVEKADVDSLTLDEDDISRQLAPRLNAVGRVKDANELVEFLLCENLEEARIAAARYEQIHLERKLKIDQCAQALKTN